MSLAEVVELLQSASYAVNLLDSDRRVVFQTPEAAQLLGMPPDKAIGMCCHELIGGCDREGNPVCSADCDVFQRLREKKPVESYDLLARAPGGGWAAINITIATVAPDDVAPLTVQVLHPAEDNASTVRTANPKRRDDCPLTSREVEVLRLVAAGNGVAEIANRLVLSGATVRNHIRNIMGKLDAHTRLQAVLAAAQAGIL